MKRDQQVVFKSGIDENVEIRKHGNTKWCHGSMLEINPAMGCEFKCQYCNVYTQEAESTFGQITIYKDFPEYFENYLIEHRHTLDSKYFYFSPKIECFQPCLIESGITQEILRICNKYKANYFALTKTGMPPKTIQDLLIEGNRHNQVIISSAMPNERTREILEPGAPSIAERLDFARFCVGNGIYTTSIISPILPVENLRFVREHIAKLIKIGVKHFNFDFAQLSRDSLAKIVALLPEFKEELERLYLDSNAEFTDWKVPFRDVELFRFRPPLEFITRSFFELRDYAMSMDPEASASVCNVLNREFAAATASATGPFNGLAKEKGINCIGARFLNQKG